MLSKNEFHGIAEVIDYVKETAGKDDDFCLYGLDGDALEVKGAYFVSDYPSVCNEEEVYPPEVVRRGLIYLYSGEQFIDVVTLALKQKPQACDELLVRALNYYQENDDFLDV